MAVNTSKGYWAVAAMLTVGYSNDAYSGRNCWNTSTLYHSFNLPPIIRVEKNAGIGEVMATVQQEFYERGAWNCERWYTTTYKADFVSGRPSRVPGLSDLWSTGIPGVGMRITYSHRSDSALHFEVLPWSTTYQRIIDNMNAGKPYKLIVEFVRTGNEVGSGVVKLNSDVEVWNVSPYLKLNRLTLRGSSRFINDMIYSSCEPIAAVTDVNMGEVDIRDIESGSARETEFDIDFRCQGVKPSTPPPVNVTFLAASSWTQPGLLGIKQETGSASGVAIALTDKNGGKVMFSPAAMKTDWVRSEQTAEVYRFSGRAKYVKHVSAGSSITPGKANGAMTYVINYL